jgi:signal transduction histidine kinase
MTLAIPNDIANLRNRLLNDALLWISAVSLPALTISLSRTASMGWRPFFVIQIVLVMLLWGAWFLRQRINFTSRASLLLMSLAGAGVAGYMHVGLIAAAGHLIIMFQFLAALLLSGPAALRVCGFVAIALVGVAWAAISGIISFNVDYSAAALSPTNWSLVLYIVICYGGVVAVLGWRMFNELISQQHALREANEQLTLRTHEAEAANKLKGEILANLSHEFRTPLNGVLGMTDLLQSTEFEDDRRVWLGELKTSAMELGGKLDRMIDFAKLTANAVKLSSGPFALHELVENSVKSTRTRAKAKGLALTLRIDPEIPQAVATDGQRLQQVLGELLDNAVKFTATGSIDVNISLAVPPPDDRRHWISLTVKDSGPGISISHQQFIFQAFYQADGSSTRMTGGNGLGLAISQQSAQLLGGSITLASNTLGSQFTVTVPLDRVSAEYLQ